MKHPDEWIEDRIRFQAGKCNIPTGRTCFLADAPHEVQAEVGSTITGLNSGTPVLLGYGMPNQWTLISTRQLIGISGRRLSHIDNCDVAEITSRDYPPNNRKTELSSEEIDAWMEETGRPKQSWEYLQVSDVAGGKREFWVPAGSEAFAFWNILLMLTRLDA